MQFTAQQWLVYTMTKSAFLLGLLGVAQFGPVSMVSAYRLWGSPFLAAVQGLNNALDLPNTYDIIKSARTYYLHGGGELGNTGGRFICVKLECMVESEKRGKGA